LDERPRRIFESAKSSIVSTAHWLRRPASKRAGISGFDPIRLNILRRFLFLSERKIAGSLIFRAPAPSRD